METLYQEAHTLQTIGIPQLDLAATIAAPLFRRAFAHGIITFLQHFGYYKTIAVVVVLAADKPFDAILNPNFCGMILN